MSAPLVAGLTPGLVLSGGYVLRVTALDPLTGDVNTDVIVSDVALQVDAPERIAEPVKIPLLPPLYAHEAPGLDRGV